MENKLNPEMTLIFAESNSRICGKSNLSFVFAQQWLK